MARLRVDDLDAFLPMLAKAGVEALESTRIEAPERNSIAVFVADPDGTPIDLVQQPGD